MDWKVSIADIIQIAVLIFVVIQANLALRAFRADHERRRKEATFQFVNAVSDRYKMALHSLNSKHGVDRVVDVSEFDDEDTQIVKNYLSEVERICAGVNAGVFDYHILRKMMAGSLIKNHNRFGQYIMERQEVRKSYYSEFSYVVSKLRSDEDKPFAPEAHIQHSK